MPQRQSVVRVKTPELQGEGSYVVMAAMKVREIREYRKQAQEKKLNEETGEMEPTFDAFEGGVDMLKTHVLEWNWVDDHGNPLDQVPANEDVINELTNDESEFLATILTEGPPQDKQEDETKNSEGGS